MIDRELLEKEALAEECALLVLRPSRTRSMRHQTQDLQAIVDHTVNVIHVATK
jgi:hypothetical protein